MAITVAINNSMRIDEITRRDFLKGAGAAVAVGAAGGVASAQYLTSPAEQQVEHEYKIARAEALGKSGKPLDIPLTGYPKDREVKHAYDLARAKARGTAGKPYDGPTGYPAATEVEHAWKIARARSRGAAGLPMDEGIKSKLAGAALAGALAMNPAHADKIDLTTPINQMKADTAYKIAIAKKRGKAGLPLNMPDVTGPVTIYTPLSHMEILDAYNMARAEAGIKPIYPIDKIKEQDLEEASPDAVQRIEQLVRYK